MPTCTRSRALFLGPDAAAICGLPIVATRNVGAARDVLVEGVSGLTVPEYDEALLASAMTALIRDPRGSRTRRGGPTPGEHQDNQVGRDTVRERSGLRPSKRPTAEEQVTVVPQPRRDFGLLWTNTVGCDGFSSWQHHFRPTPGRSAPRTKQRKECIASVR